jgi:hypothetical protein
MTQSDIRLSWYHRFILSLACNALIKIYSNYFKDSDGWVRKDFPGYLENINGVYRINFTFMPNKE